ncbi:glycosyltransferase family 4 protein [Microbulbifer magnicolonia]|uniref:glycosyltransferase family 4 protein n=1 Tax=Microbulbifer magnicolonia TaxID=3109744 RepID=UPI002B412A70|nr:glycosyltransferase family 4 protein [Microbulbifer sp. GG15]
MLSIGFLTIESPYDRNSFSGTIHYMFRALCEQPDVEVSLVAEQVHRRRPVAARLLGKLQSKQLPSFGLLDTLADKVEQQHLRALRRHLYRERSRYDVLVAPVASDLIGTIRNGDELPPIIFVTDATHGFLREEYKWPLTEDHRRNEVATVKNASAVVYSSQYMADRAKMEFDGCGDGRRGKFDFIPFGLNMDVVEGAAAKHIDNHLRILFVGKDWHRKGGDTALEVARQLRSAGVDLTLTIVGANPVEARNIDWVRVYPFLDKNDASEQRQYYDLLKESHFLLLPTRADCTPMVIAEANAFGTPAVTSAVGGIPSLITDGVNGCMLDVAAVPQKYADVIRHYWHSQALYERLSVSSRRTYEEKLTWGAWARGMVARAQLLVGEALAEE